MDGGLGIHVDKSRAIETFRIGKGRPHEPSGRKGSKEQDYDNNEQVKFLLQDVGKVMANREEFNANEATSFLSD